VTVTSENAVYPLSGEYLAKPKVVAAAQEEVRVASMARYGIQRLDTSHLSSAHPTYGAFLTPSLGDSMTFKTPNREPKPPRRSLQSEVIALPGGATMSRVRTSPRVQHVVIIRHGKTENNKMGLFTGWDDVSLAKEGRAEATAAGKLLAASGIKFDVVYTSWLSRAIETAWLVLVELDAMHLPIHKSWRLNERMYGSLTGLSKKNTRTVYGDVQFKKWRRSYDTKPPAVSSFSHQYPGNDQRYVDNVDDVRISLKETLIRSVERGRLVLHPKLPRTESLKDCMDRTIPYWVNSIEGEAIKQGKSVLVASSENAIRGLLMHLLKIPTTEISNIEIPTGLPLLFDMRHRCLKLLDGDFTDYNFGTAADLLFTPCEIPDEDYEEIDLQSLREQSMQTSVEEEVTAEQRVRVQ